VVRIKQLFIGKSVIEQGRIAAESTRPVLHRLSTCFNSAKGGQAAAMGKIGQLKVCFPVVSPRMWVASTNGRCGANSGRTPLLALPAARRRKPTFPLPRAKHGVRPNAASRGARDIGRDGARPRSPSISGGTVRAVVTPHSVTQARARAAKFLFCRDATGSSSVRGSQPTREGTSPRRFGGSPALSAETA
jgi:hypothetical protein